jgi:hypothetical protein
MKQKNEDLDSFCNDAGFLIRRKAVYLSELRFWVYL